MRRFDELSILARLQARTPVPPRSGLTLGIGDDCAIYRPRGSSEDLLFTTDMLIEDIHFRRQTHSAEIVGRKALARSLSDIAAMGGAPRFCLLSLALPPWADQRWTDAFYRGFLKLATEAGAALAGGDLAHAEKLSCDVMICGAVPKGTALRRDGAKPGDEVWVSGRLGASALGLQTCEGAAWKRHLRPEPRLALGRFLREELRATAAMDLSDGLSIDLHRLCVQSKVAAELASPIPVFRGATLEQALHGGEDYELVFTVRKGTKVPAAFERIPLTRIGRIGKGRPGDVTLDGGPVPRKGYDHFRR